MKAIWQYSLALGTFFYYFESSALSLTENFVSNSSKESSEMVWNISAGKLHAPIIVIGWNSGSGVTNTLLDVGDGSHGVFNSSTYSQFSKDGDISSNTIRFDTDAYPILKVTSFTLDSGWTLQPVGANPLVIKSLSTVQINGTIQCSGIAGNALVTDSSSVVIGGKGRCGGGNGGNSVAPSVAPAAINKGVSGGTGVTGGDGGPINLATGGQGGGGGGSFIEPFVAGPDKPNPTNGDNSAAGVGGLAGTRTTDDAFLVTYGAGSGGGGGSAYTHVADTANHSSGASGGGGGGTIHITAIGNVNVSATGSIYVDGGAGGGGVSTRKGGGGGGGGAGSVAIYSVGDIVTDGIIRAQAGSGGVTNGGDGGNGAWGRTWIVEKDGFASGAVVENPTSNLINPGAVRYQTGVTYTVLSSAIDLRNTIPNLTSHTLTIPVLGGSILNFRVAQSDSTDASGFGAWTDPTTLYGTDLKRFLKFRIQLDNTNATNSVSVDSLNFEYSGNTDEEFDFVGGCGLVGKNEPPPMSGTLLLTLLFLMFPVTMALKWKARYQ